MALLEVCVCVCVYTSGFFPVVMRFRLNHPLSCCGMHACMQAHVLWHSHTTCLLA